MTSEDLTEYRLNRVEGAVEVLSEAVNDLKEFAVQTKAHIKIGGGLLLIVLGSQPFVEKLLGV